MALRSPLRRLGLVLFLPCVVFGLVDGVRAWVEREPRLVQADEYVPGFSHERVTATGLMHPEQAIPYQVGTFHTYGGRKPNRGDKPVETVDFVLIPLNVSERSGNRLMLAELPLEGEELPEELRERGRYEFTGLVGPVSDELRHEVLGRYPSGTVISRLQLRQEGPRLVVSLALMVMPLLLLRWMLWRADTYNRSQDAARGYPQKMSLFFLVIALPWPAYLMWMRLRREADVDSVGFVVFAYGMMLFFLFIGSLWRGRRVELEPVREASVLEEPRR
jgi:hypothetical protein